MQGMEPFSGTLRNPDHVLGFTQGATNPQHQQHSLSTGSICFALAVDKPFVSTILGVAADVAQQHDHAIQNAFLFTWASLLAMKPSLRDNQPFLVDNKPFWGEPNQLLTFWLP